MGAFFTEFSAYFRSGGPLMYPMALLACTVYYIGFDLIFKLLKIEAESSKPELLLKRFAIEPRRNGDFQRLCRQDIKKCFDLLRLSIMPEIERSIKVIGILATVAPLLGLLGTVSGMTMAISAMGGVSENISAGISHALITTQCGLLIAIPALVMRLVCSRLRQKILIKISRYETEIILVEACA